MNNAKRWTVIRFWGDDIKKHTNECVKAGEEAIQDIKMEDLEYEAEEGVRIIKEIKNPNDTHKYCAKACIREINKRIQKDNIILMFNEREVPLNMYHVNLFTSYFGIKENERLCLHIRFQRNHSIAIHSKQLILYMMK